MTPTKLGSRHVISIVGEDEVNLLGGEDKARRNWSNTFHVDTDI